MKLQKKQQLILRHINRKYISKIFFGRFAIYFLNTGSLNNLQYKAILFFLKKKLKIFTKIFIRLTKSIQNTKKPIGVRMGKGKGALNDYYFPVEKGQIFLEIYFNYRSYAIDKLLVKKLKTILYYVNKKLNIKIGVIFN
jgi:large subunit ribosomal protein L16